MRYVYTVFVNQCKYVPKNLDSLNYKANVKVFSFFEFSLRKHSVIYFCLGIMSTKCICKHILTQRLMGCLYQSLDHSGKHSEMFGQKRKALLNSLISKVGFFHVCLHADKAAVSTGQCLSSKVQKNLESLCPFGVRYRLQ